MIRRRACKPENMAGTTVHGYSYEPKKYMVAKHGCLKSVIYLYFAYKRQAQHAAVVEQGG